MLIAVDFDNLTVNEINLLRALYPNEKALRIGQITEKTKFTEKNGSPTTRISFCAHGGFGSFGGYSAEDFADEVVQKLSAAAETNPEIKKSLRDIDLFGCMVGCDNGRDEVYAEKVGKLVNAKLAQEGFQSINFKAVTNRTLGQDSQFYAVYLSVPEVGTDETNFQVIGNETKEDFDNEQQIKTEIKRIVAEIKRLEANNGGNGLTIQEELQKNFDNYDITKASRGKDPYIDKANQTIEFLSPFKDTPDVAKQIKRIEALKDRYTRVKDLNEQGCVLFKKLDQHLTVIHGDFKDPRKLVDQNPACNFTSQARKFSALKARFEQMTKDDNTPSNTRGLGRR